MSKGKRNTRAQFSASGVAERVDIRGAAHKATIGPDGWAIFRDVPILGPVPKGVKNAPEDVGPSLMKKFVSFSLSDYEKGNYAAPVHKGHHKSLAIEDPEFLGFFLPKKVGTATIEGESQPAVLADIKLKPSAFESAKKGELPYLSPELDWETGQFLSLSFLDSNPPHFKFPMFTVGEVLTDSTAKFEAALKPAAVSFAAGACCRHCMSFQSKYGKTFEDSKMADDAPNKDKVKKPEATPVEPNISTTMSSTPASVKFEVPPELAAQFSALKDELAATRKRLDDVDAEKAAKALEASALESLRGFQIGESAKAQVAEFAKLGKEKLDKFVATLKEIAPKEPPRTMAEFMGQSVPVTDPALAKFSSNPADLEVARRAYAEFQAIKKSAKGYPVPLDKHIEFAVRRAKAATTEGGN